MPSTVGLGQRVQATAVGARLTGHLATDKDGGLTLPAGLLAQAGLDVRENLIYEAEPNGLRLTSDVLRKVYVEATSRCNLTCVTCIRNAWDEPIGHMPLTRYRRMLAGLPARQAELVEAKNTGLWGNRSPGPTPPPTRPGPPITLAFGGFGEPLAHPDFLEMVHLARERGLRVEITTNGTLLDAALARELVAAGVAKVTISMDGADAHTYADVRGGALETIVANVAALQEARRRARRSISVGLAFVAMRRNIASLPQLMQLAGRLGMDFVSVSNVIPHTPEMAGEALWNRAAWISSFAPETWRPRLTLASIDLDETTRPALQAVWEAGLAPPLPALEADARRDTCRFAHEGVTCVAWDGRVAPCLSLLHAHPEYVNEQWHRVAAYTVGHVDERPLSDIWRDAAYRDFRERVRTFDFAHCFSCGGCPLTESNEEDCYGNPFPVCGECLWAQGIVLCP